MLSYQHAYHAGHAADVCKHALLALLINKLATKPSPLHYYETHAGRGLYPLNGPEISKTNPHLTGVVPLLEHAHKLPPELHGYIELLKRLLTETPPSTAGSPLIAHTLLRPTDILTLCELHDGERLHLKTWAKQHANVHVHAVNGHMAIPPLLPPASRRALVLIDPSYELKTEYETVVKTCQNILKRWPQSVVLVWYPLLPAGRHSAMLQGLKGLNCPSSYVAELTWPEIGNGMYGSGQVVLNLPFGIEKIIEQTFSALQNILTTTGPAQSSCMFLHPPV